MHVSTSPPTSNPVRSVKRRLSEEPAETQQRKRIIMDLPPQAIGKTEGQMFTLFQQAYLRKKHEGMKREEALDCIKKDMRSYQHPALLRAYKKFLEDHGQDCKVEGVSAKMSIAKQEYKNRQKVQLKFLFTVLKPLTVFLARKNREETNPVAGAAASKLQLRDEATAEAGSVNTLRAANSQSKVKARDVKELLPRTEKASPSNNSIIKFIETNKEKASALLKHYKATKESMLILEKESNRLSDQWRSYLKGKNIERLAQEFFSNKSAIISNVIRNIK